MNAAIELHDSEVQAIEKEADGSGYVLLNAYVHRTSGQPRSDAGECGLQRFKLLFETIAVVGDIGVLPAYIYEGHLKAGAELTHLIELPGPYANEVQLTMTLSDNARELTVSGTKLTLIPEREFRYVEPSP